jgi:N utilization substance protein B
MTPGAERRADGDPGPARSGRKGRRAGPGARSAARLAAVQALYQIELTGATTEGALDEFERRGSGGIIESDAQLAVDRALVRCILEGVGTRAAEIDGYVEEALTAAWPLARLEVLLRAILRAGAYELLVGADVPARVVISEYVNLGHAFFGDKETGLVNGVLDRLARRLRLAEMEAAADGGLAPRG